MTENFQAYLSEILRNNITKITSVHGGDISDAYRLDTSKNSYFLKCHSGAKALKMFKAEAKGLKLISESNSIKSPEVITADSYDSLSFLLMEFIPSRAPSSGDLRALGKQLAELHRCTADTFGLDHNNNIGRLPQSNFQHKTWRSFYTYERLLPQLDMARTKGLLQDADCPSPDHILRVLETFFTNVKPSLLHGDLWSGNYLISENGVPYLIDPAVYYGDGLVDIAMSKLFGGFSTSFYEAYHEVHPKAETYAERIDLYQLYYLLVHLNMFGSSYRPGVTQILSRYF